MSILDHFPESLTDDQKRAVQNIETFLASPSNCFLLNGYAGTGKTFLMEGMVKYFRSAGRNYRMMAPTGRAAMIIGDKTKSTAYTIHKSIYNLDELEDDEHTFRMRYKLNLNEDSVNSVYLIDESSMISDIYSEDEFFIVMLKVKTLQFHCSYFSFYKCFSFVVCQNIERTHIQ